MADPLSSSPESVPDPPPLTPRSPRRSKSQGAWSPGRAFLALTLATLASGVTRAGGSVPPGKLMPAPPRPTERDWMRRAGDRTCAREPWRDSAHLGQRGPLGACRAAGPFDSTRGFPGEGPQPSWSTRTPPGEVLTLLTANVTTWATGTAAGALDSESEVPMLQEVRPREKTFRASHVPRDLGPRPARWAHGTRLGGPRHLGGGHPPLRGGCPGPAGAPLEAG